MDTTLTVERSGKRVRILGVLMMAGALLMGVGMWRRPTHALKVEPIKPDLYLLHSEGMNVVALVTETGVVLIDSMPEGWWGADYSTRCPR